MRWLRLGQRSGSGDLWSVDARSYEPSPTKTLRIAYATRAFARTYRACMPATRPHPISIADASANLSFLADRTPRTTAEQSEGAFRNLVAYRDGAVFVGYWAGTSEWERHPAGDEIVLVLEGRTTIFFLTDEGELAASLGPNELVIVPQSTWHRFETPDGVTVLSVTPQPTEHSADLPT